MWYFHYNALINALASTLFGIIAFSKNPRDPKNVTYAFYCFSLSLWSYSYVLWQISPTAASALLFSRILMMGAILIPMTHIHHLLNLFEWKAPRVLKIGYTLCGLLLISNCTPLFIAGVRPKLFFSFWPVPGPLFLPYLFGFFTCLIYSLFMIYRARKSAVGYKRNLLSWVFAATVIGYGGGATNFPLWYNIPVLPFGNCLVSLYSLMVFYILSRYRLMDITVVVRKTLVYTAVMVVLTTIYIGGVTLFAHLFEGLTGYRTIFSSAMAAGMVTFCFQPLRKYVQRLVDSKFFRQYVDREEQLYELSREVITHTTPEAMGGALMRVIEEALHPKSGALFLRARDGSGFVRVAGTGEATLPERMEEDNGLAKYFRDHPQPFVQDLSQDEGHSMSTREKSEREDAA